MKDTMRILGDSISRTSDFLNIYELKFLADNPRVYSCTHGIAGFAKKTDEEKQQVIYKALLEESSVKNLIPEIRRHEGLMESILVRWDTKEVIEGNSRLAVYRKLHKQDENNDNWELIPCEIVSGLTPEQQAAFLNQVHVKGKTQWSPYEKANFAHARSEGGWPVKKIAQIFGESEPTIHTRIAVIKMMKKNRDTTRSHFSFYDVLARNPEAKKCIEKGGLKKLLSDIKAFGEDQEENDFTALEMRKMLPAVLSKPKVLKKYESGKLCLKEAYDRAEISRAEDKVKRATALLDDVERSDIEILAPNERNALKLAFKRHQREVKRIEDIIGS